MQSKPLLNYYDKLQVTTHRLFPKFCTSKSESHHQAHEFKIIIIIRMIIHSAGNNKSDSSKQQFHNSMDCNRPYNKTKYTHVEYFVLSTHTALFLPQSYLMHPTPVFNFFPKR